MLCSFCGRDFVEVVRANPDRHWVEQAVPRCSDCTERSETPLVPKEPQVLDCYWFYGPVPGKWIAHQQAPGRWFEFGREEPLTWAEVSADATHVELVSPPTWESR